jgi:signal transduction histidine kinase/DNA-binding response OmpR family regulator
VIKKIILYIVCFCFQPFCWAQDYFPISDDLTFEEISIAHNDGLQSWENIDTFYEDENGIIWCFIDDGLYRFNGHSAINVTKYLTTFHKLDIENQPATQFLKSDHIIWYGQRKGLYKIDLNTLLVKKIFLDKPLYPADWRNYIQEIKEYKDTLYIGTANGLYLVNPFTDKVIAKYLNDGIDIQHRESSNAVESIFPDIEKDAIWVTLSKGLYRIDKNTQSIEEFTIKNTPYSYPHNFHSGKLYNDVLVMSSHGLGMVEFNLKTKQFSNYLTNPEKIYNREDNVIRSVIELNDSLLLVNAVNLGNGLFNRYTKEYNWLETSDILKEGVFLNLDRSGFVWASKRGRIFRSKNPVVANRLPFKHMLDVSSFKSNNVLKSSPSIEGYVPINLLENERNIDLEFSITKPHILDSIRYEYRLNSDTWQPTKTNNELKLFDLSSGKHQLSLRALDSRGKMLASREFQINIHLPFYKSPYFIALCLLIGLSLIYWFERYRNQQKINAKLQELDVFKSRLFANISHEFRTPLTLISGPIEKRLNQEELHEDDRTEFTMIQRNSNRLLNLVDQLLDLSKLESGHLKLKVVQGNLSLFLKALASSFQHTANKKRIEYNIDIAEINNAWFDKDVIEKTIVNLLSNAFKYTSEGGHITFSASILDNHAVFYIENDSQQFTKTQIDHIFNRFYQIDENAQGVGIGLSLVKELVTLSHGKISVENASSNSIAFRVSLPILKSQFQPDEIVEDIFEPSIKESKNYLVETDHETEQVIDEDLPILLIVDDHEDIRNFIKSAFKNNYQVVEAMDGEIGVKKAIELIPDIIISDVMMPKLNGFQLAEKLKQDERTCHIPIILLTAKADDADRFIGLETGADDYMVKPFKIKGLETRVKNLITSREKLRERYSQEIVLKPKDIAVSNFDEQFLEKVQDVLDNKLVESSFNTEDFSKAVGLSRMQLHRKIKALTGLTASEFIRSQRLKLAAQLLKTSDINVSQIGYTVGFNDHSYFAKCFKEAYKCTPTDYAKKYS